MTKEERKQNAEELLETAKKIGQIEDLELKGVAKIKKRTYFSPFFHHQLYLAMRQVLQFA